VSGKGQCEHAMPPHGRESTVPPSEPSLPTNRVFVVQFRAQPTGASSSYDGRVEHLVSGQVARFHSLEELLGFMIRMLTDVEEQADSP
jgi:hypothetical protein